jgi:hypothetical protein
MQPSELPESPTYREARIYGGTIDSFYGESSDLDAEPKHMRPGIELGRAVTENATAHQPPDK